MREPQRSESKPGLVPGFLLLALVSACNEPATEASPAGTPATLTIAGYLDDEDIDEASGIAFSRRADDVLWVHNDSGAKARLYAIDEEGRSRGRLKLDDADNDDWEDMASYSTDGEALLVVADIGDNEASRKKLRLYIVAEPDLDDDVFPEIEPRAKISFRYPDGARDAEAMAVDVGDDAGNARALILSKRDLPPRLYAVSIAPGSRKTRDADLLGEVTTLPRPSRRDVEFAPKTKDWHWQPTAMDISPDGRTLAILTYRAVYLYSRSAGEDWMTALARPPLAFGLRKVPNAEALAFGPDGLTLFVTVEKRNAPLLRIDRLHAGKD